MVHDNELSIDIIYRYTYSGNKVTILILNTPTTPTWKPLVKFRQTAVTVFNRIFHLNVQVRENLNISGKKKNA
jgi:hypothetical protein